MRGLRRGIVSLALAGALATGGFIGGMMLSGGAATAATGGTTTALTGTAVAATASPNGASSCRPGTPARVQRKVRRLVLSRRIHVRPLFLQPCSQR